MKTQHLVRLTALVATLAAALVACKKEDHAGHDHGKTSGKAAKQIAGPKGGKLLEGTSPRAEFVIGADRRVTVAFYDDQLKPVAASAQVVAVTAEPKTGKTALSMESKDGAFASKEPLPDGDSYTIVVQIKTTAEAAPQNFRIPLNLSDCGGCKRKEYACTCDH